jgi:tryptophanyl-tRNA synthetase
LDPVKSNFIVQSQVAELSELTDYLMMFTPYSLVKNNPTVKHELKSLDSK